MTEEEYRSLALSMPEAVEGAHMRHADFRVRTKIFATLWPDGVTGVLKLSPEQQALLVEAQDDIFRPAKGAWGAKGMTEVRFDRLSASALQAPMRMAWENTAPITLVRDHPVAGLSGGGPARTVMPLLVTDRPRALVKEIEARFGGCLTGPHRSGWGEADRVELDGLVLLIMRPAGPFHRTQCAFRLTAGGGEGMDVATDGAGNRWYAGSCQGAHPILQLIGLQPMAGFVRDCLGGTQAVADREDGIYAIGDMQLELQRATSGDKHLLSAFVVETGDVAARVAASGAEIVATGDDGSWAIVRDVDWTLWVFDRGAST